MNPGPRFRSALLASAALLFCLPVGSQHKQQLTYPTTRRGKTVDNLHGTRVADPYRWLEKAKVPAVQRWMQAQDKLARDYLLRLPHKAALVKRLRQLYYIDSISAPRRRGKRYFYTRRHRNKEKQVVYFRIGKQGREQVLLDPNTWSKDGSVSLGNWSVDRKGMRVAYQVRSNNADEAVLHVKNVTTGKVSAIDRIAGARYAYASWTPNGKGFYYTWLPTDPNIPPQHRPGYAEIRFHRLGTDPKRDRIIYARTGDPTIFLGVGLSRNGRWLFLYKWRGWAATDIYYKDLKKKNAAFKLFIQGKRSNWSVYSWKRYFYIWTNEGAPNGKLYRTLTTSPTRKHWKLIVPERTQVVLEGSGIFGSHLITSVLKDARRQLEVRSATGKLLRPIAGPGLGSISGLTGNPKDDEIFFSYSTFLRPPRILVSSVKSGKTETWRVIKVPIDARPFTAKQVWYQSKDGTRVSMFLIHRKDLKRDGTTPFLLYGYGGFSVSLTPQFSATMYPMLEKGMGYAIANLRGGAEFGEQWHRAGMLLNKQNTFDDFIAAAQYLIKKGYTRPGKLAIQGGSNGGLLVGAAMTQRPKLFRAVVCSVPLLDMVRYHLFGSGRTWIREYGSAEDKEQFMALYKYSPYHRVKKGTPYPALLLLSADSDDRVDPMHARKMAAAVQYASSSGRPVLLRSEKKAGHGGGGMVKKWVASVSDIIAFLFSELGVE